jgi:hypothetical protein
MLMEKPETTIVPIVWVVSRSPHPAISKEEAAKQQKLRLQAAAYAARRDLGLTGETGTPRPPSFLLMLRL